MRKLETWLTGLLMATAALAFPVAALEPPCPGDDRAAAAGPAATACDDGSAHLAMGCASTLL